MEVEKWRKDMERWLKGFPWLWFGSMTFRPGLKPGATYWRLHIWLDELQKSLGTGDFGYFAVREFGKTGQDLHFHVLIMGLKASHYDERLEWMRRWSKLAGDAQINPYSTKAGGIAYILKNVDPQDPDAIDFKLSSDTRLETDLDEACPSKEEPIDL
jgi:hypothetical protein